MLGGHRRVGGHPVAVDAGHVRPGVLALLPIADLSGCHLAVALHTALIADRQRAARQQEQT